MEILTIQFRKRNQHSSKDDVYIVSHLGFKVKTKLLGIKYLDLNGLLKRRSDVLYQHGDYDYNIEIESYKI